MKRNHPESRLQCACVLWFRYQYPQKAKLLFAIPNGGQRSRVEAAIMKGEGVTPGVPDLFLSIARGGFNGLYLEAKTPGNKSTPNQREMQALLEADGYLVVVFDNSAQFETVVNNYMRLPKNK